MNKKEREKLLTDAKIKQGRRKNRYVDAIEIDKMAEMDRKKALFGKTIRIYSSSGFVPKSYNKGFFTPIDFIERHYVDGVKKFYIGTTGASRPFGQGSLITIDGKGI